MPIPVFFLLLLLLQIIFLPGLLTQGGKVSNPHRTIVVGGNHSLPPFEYLDENSEPAGYNVALTQALATEMGVDVECLLGEQAQIRKDLISGRIDILLGMMEAEAEKEGLLFTPHTQVRQKVFSHRNNLVKVSSLEQLQGKNIVVKRNGTMHRVLLNNKIAAELVLVNTHADALRQVALGNCDYALIANRSSLYLNRHVQYLEKELGEDSIVQAGELLPVLRYGYVATKEKQNLIENFRVNLLNLKNNGLQREIHDRWLGSAEAKGINEKPRRTQIGELIFSPLILAVCTVVFWNRSLKQEVECRSTKLALQQQQLLQADKMASLGTLVSGVAHEINNPTGLILYNLSVLEKIYQTAESTLEQRYQEEGDFFIGGLKYSMLREESAEVFCELKDGATRIKQIVDDLKDFARKDSLELEEFVNLNKVAEAAARLVKSSLKKTTCNIETSYSASLPEFIGNSHRIEQVVINLLLNACQALTSHEQVISMRTFVDSKQQELVLEVQDEGVGIAADQLDKLTDPFYTTKREQGGTGLGLSVSAGIIAEHKGRMVFDSEPGVGTKVSIYLPIQEEA